MEIEFKSELWEWQGQAAWCFISLPKEYRDEIRLISSAHKKGFGSVRVEAATGKTTWKTSIFPDSKTNTYLLPIKKQVRSAEGLSVGSTASIKLRFIDV